MTQYLGFPALWRRIQGHGPRGLRQVAGYNEHARPRRGTRYGNFRLNLKFFRHHRDDIAYEWHGGEPTCGTLYSQHLVETLGPARKPDEPLTDRHRNLAWATQAVYEDAFFNLLSSLQRRSGHTSIALAGGCAHNSVANGKIRDRTVFRHSYLQSAAGDAGGAIGAAYAVWHRNGKRAGEMKHAYWGPAFTDRDIETLLSERGSEFASQGCNIRHFDNETDLLETTARAIAGA